MTQRPRVYLAGPIQGDSYQVATSWRETAAALLEQLGVEAVSPLRGFGFLDGVASMPASAPEHELGGAAVIFQRDTQDVKGAHGLLVNLAGTKRASIGTAFEMGIAHTLGLPIVVVVSENESLNPHVGHAFIEQAAWETVEWLADGARRIATLVKQSQTTLP